MSSSIPKFPKGGAGGTPPTRIGQLRQSHLVVSNGVGSIVDLPSLSVIVQGLDSWSQREQRVLDEPRLLQEVRASLGNGVQSLRAAPWTQDSDGDPWSDVGVPVTAFPRWYRCPVCYRLASLDGSEFQLAHEWGRRPDLAKFVHKLCQKQNMSSVIKRRACIPSRFLVVCEEGHLDDFPYVEFVHHGASGLCDGPQLTISDSASTISPQVNVRCTNCNASQNIAAAAGIQGRARLPLCRGRHPHLGTFDECGKELRLMVVGASNLWFSITASALHLPQDRGPRETVADQWVLLKDIQSLDTLQALVAALDQFKSLRDMDPAWVMGTIEEFRAAGGPVVASSTGNLLDEEWDLLSHPTTERQDADFKAVPRAAPEGHGAFIDQVVQVTRLREVQALVGFTRIGAPEGRELQPANAVSLSARPLAWVPATEQRGEGIFIELNEKRLSTWELEVSSHPRIAQFADAYSRWSANRGRKIDPIFPIPRYLLLHTLSHLLIRQVSLECGYSSASIKERIYYGHPGARQSGILLSTAASDSEGTLGGLVSLGDPAYLGRLLDQTFEQAAFCSSDPLCSDHMPEDPSEALHGAACHACLFASETTCECNNRWLDRGLLADVTRDGVSFL